MSTNLLENLKAIQREDFLSAPGAERGLNHVIIFQKVVRTGQQYMLPILYLIQPLAHGHVRVHRVDALIDYLINHSSRSSTWKLRFARAIGLLVDFTVAASGSGKLKISKLGSDFANALVHGTKVKTDKAVSDVLGLYWSTRSRGVCKELMKSLQRFLNWQVDTEGVRSWSYSFLSINSDPVAAMRAAKNKLISKRTSLLSYIDRAFDSQPIFASGITGERPGSGRRIFRFPSKFLWPLLFEGFRSKTDHIDEASEIVAFIQAMGGCRSSEPFHLWVQDIQFVDGEPIIFLHHPEDGAVIDDQGVRWTRSQYLLENYSRRPRNKLHKQKEFAGWKGVDEEAIGSPIYWLPIDGIGRTLAKLLLHYLQVTRPQIMRKRRKLGLPDHPYLLVSDGEHSDDPTSTGAPFTMSAYYSAWERAIARLSARYGDPTLTVVKNHGTTTHGLRHFYGSFLRTLGLDGLVIQACMHHKSKLSQLVYTALTPTEINTLLSKRAKTDAPIEHKSVEEALASMRQTFNRQRGF
jgi:integrase